ncbi:expressed unknown protein [Seminavis robusta]|uniref:Uncharacterized protein n=1 Tax=Seminavis robusta TaxID=568900 RepID=A0A9N8E7M6_9STRA|nr:expressed unknown protein [Seminavis robusta]|eukprot:Sro709_g190840.1 n/a (1296) ;mRNA; r:16703-20590
MMVLWGQDDRGAASSLFVLGLVLLCVLEQATNAVAAEVVFGLQLNDDAADSYGSSMSYDARTHRLYITGGTYSGYFKTGLSQVDEAAIKSDCFFGVLQLPQQVFMSPQWIRRVQIGMPDVTEACSALYVSQNNGDVYLLGHSTHSASVMAPLEAQDSSDATISASRLHTQPLSAVSPPPSAAGMIMQLARGATLVGGSLMADDEVQYPIAVQGDPDAKHLFVASIKSLDGRTNPKFEQLKGQTQALHLDMSTAGYLPPEYGSNFTIVVQSLIRENNHGRESDFDRFNVNIQKTLKPNWSREFGLHSPRSLQVAGLLYSTPDLLVVSGSTHRPSRRKRVNDDLGEDWDGFLLFLHPSTGQQLSSHRVRSIPNGDDRILGICKSESNPLLIYAVGITDSQIHWFGMTEDYGSQQTGYSDTESFQKGAYRAFILKMDASTMEIMWVSYVDAKYDDASQSSQPPQVHGMACAVTSDGDDVYMAGTVKQGAIMDVHDTNGAHVEAQSYGGDDIFIAQYETSEGKLNFAKQLGTMYDDSLGQGDSLVTNTNGDAIVLGNTNGSLMRNKESPATTDVFVLSLARKRGHHLPFYEMMMDVGNTKSREGFSVSTNPYYFEHETDNTPADIMLSPPADNASESDGEGSGNVPTIEDVSAAEEDGAGTGTGTFTVIRDREPQVSSASTTTISDHFAPPPEKSLIPLVVEHKTVPPVTISIKKTVAPTVQSTGVAVTVTRPPAYQAIRGSAMTATTSSEPSAASRLNATLATSVPTPFGSSEATAPSTQAPAFHAFAAPPSMAPTQGNQTDDGVAWNSTNSTAETVANTSNRTTMLPLMNETVPPKPLNATAMFQSMEKLITSAFLGSTQMPIPEPPTKMPVAEHNTTNNSTHHSIQPIPNAEEESPAEFNLTIPANRSSLPPRKDPEQHFHEAESGAIELIPPEPQEEPTELPIVPGTDDISWNEHQGSQLPGETEPTQSPVHVQTTEFPVDDETTQTPQEIQETQAPTFTYMEEFFMPSHPSQHLRTQAPGISPSLAPSAALFSESDPTESANGDVSDRKMLMPYVISLIFLANTVAIGLVLVYCYRRKRWKERAKIVPELEDACCPDLALQEAKTFVRENSDSEDVTNTNKDDNSCNSEEEVVVVEEENDQPNTTIEHSRTHDSIDGQVLMEMRPPRPPALSSLQEFPSRPLHPSPLYPVVDDDSGSTSSLTHPLRPFDDESSRSSRSRPSLGNMFPWDAIGKGHDFCRAKLWDAGESPPFFSLSRSFSSVVDISEDSVSVDKYAKEEQYDDEELDKYAKESPA